MLESKTGRRMRRPYMGRGAIIHVRRVSVFRRGDACVALVLIYVPKCRATPIRMKFICLSNNQNGSCDA